MSHDLTDKRWIPSIKQTQGFQCVSFHLITPYLSRVFYFVTLFVAVFYLVTPYLSHVFYLVTRRRIETGRVTALASDSGLGGWDHGGTGSAQEPPRLQPPHLSVYPAFNTLILPPLLKHFEYFNT